MANDPNGSTEPVAVSATTTPAIASANAGPQEGPAGIPAQSAGADEVPIGSESGTCRTEISRHRPGLNAYAAASLSGHITGEQPVYTATGPLTAEHLAGSGEAFVTLVHDPALGRYAARKAWVVPAGEGHAYAVTADGDTFTSEQGGFELAQRGKIPVGELKGGRIMACTLYKHSAGTTCRSICATAKTAKNRSTALSPPTSGPWTSRGLRRPPQGPRQAQ